MIKHHFDPQQPHRAVIYLRMSSEMQNAKSPEQQENEIRRVLNQKGYPWSIVGVVRDDAMSGRLNRKRPGYQGLLHRIRKSELKIDLILVDTLERFGRNKELQRTIDDLRRLYGVILLTADMRFEDPTTSSGQLFQMIETHRATRDNEVKAHQVLRGKRLKIQDGFWPGGPVPFGFQLESTATKSKFGKLVNNSKLVPNLVTAQVIKSVFIQSAKNAWGGEKLAIWLNGNDELLAINGKPFLQSTISKWLQNTLYIGTYVWNKYATDIENDRRIVEKKDENEIEVFENFCEPLIDLETWNKVQYYRMERAKKHKSGQVDESAGNEKIIQPRAKGVALKYPLTGLVRCGCCGSSMSPSSSTHISKRTGEEKRYARYTCVPSHSGACANKTSVPEHWLRPLVLDHIRTCLFPGLGSSTTPTSAAEMLKHEVFQNLVEMVQQECEQNRALQVDLMPQRQKEIDELEKRLDGWAMTLGDRDLLHETRRRIREMSEEAEAKIAHLKLQNDADESYRRQLVSVVDPQRIIDILFRLDQTINSENASLMNIELAQHIESITCYPDGRVILRTCKLGALAGDDSLFATENEVAVIPRDKSQFRIKDVSRPLRDTRGSIEDPELLNELNHRATEKNRFGNLGPQWFAETEFQIPEETFWAKEKAAAVAEIRMKGFSHNRLAQHFDRSKDTIVHALEIAVEKGIMPAEWLKRVPPYGWVAQNWKEVADLRMKGLTIDELLEHFRPSQPTVSQPTISKAIKKATTEGYTFPMSRPRRPKGNKCSQSDCELDESKHEEVDEARGPDAGDLR